MTIFSLREQPQEHLDLQMLMIPHPTKQWRDMLR